MVDLTWGGEYERRGGPFPTKSLLCAFFCGFHYIIKEGSDDENGDVKRMDKEKRTFSIVYTSTPFRVTWLSGWANIPWVGLDTSACKYLDGNCTRQTGEALSLTYPVKILSFYPAVIRY